MIMSHSHHQQTIFAPASPVQKSGVAVIRISGNRAGKALEALIQDALPTPRMACLRSLHAINGELLDKALILWFPAPASFTGEDVAELHVHGSIAVITSLLENLGKMEGLRLAEPGEFSKRAFENQKMDLTEAEGLADLIEAETSMQAKQALAQMQGNLHTLYATWRQDLIAMQARLEAYIDFPDEEIPTSALKEIEDKRENMLYHITSHLSDDHKGERLRQGLNVIILGPPNAGKSSLLNYLAKRDVAIVSDQAGTTRDIIDVHLDIGGYPVILSDTAGLRGEGAGAIEQEGMQRAIKRAETADVSILLLEPCSDEATIQSLQTATKAQHHMVVINKSDHPQFTIPTSLKDQKDVFSISAKTGEGVDTLLGHLKTLAAEYMGNNAQGAPLITRTRHRQLLERTAAQLCAFNPALDLEIAAEELRGAAHALGQIIGRIDVEDILDELFSQFCIGK